MAAPAKPPKADGLPVLSRTLEGLPVELRRKIYSYLLISDQVRQPPDQLLIRSYRFETAILSVNKRINTEASEVLYNENKFVTISCKYILPLLFPFSADIEVMSHGGSKHLS